MLAWSRDYTLGKMGMTKSSSSRLHIFLKEAPKHLAALKMAMMGAKPGL